jgi:hypothetical protein
VPGDGASGRQGKDGGLGEVHLSSPPSFSRSSFTSETISSFEPHPVPIYPKANRVASHASLSLVSNCRSDVALQDLAKPRSAVSTRFLSLLPRRTSLIEPCSLSIHYRPDARWGMLPCRGSSD